MHLHCPASFSIKHFQESIWKIFFSHIGNFPKEQRYPIDVIDFNVNKHINCNYPLEESMLQKERKKKKSN